MLDGIRGKLEEQLERLLGEAERPMTIEEMIPHLDPVMPSPNDVADVLAGLAARSDVRRDGSYYAKPTPVPVDHIFAAATPGWRSKARTVVEIIRALDEEGEAGEGAPLQSLLRAAKERGVTKDEVLDIVSRLRINGEAYSPRKDSVRLTKL